MIQIRLSSFARKGVCYHVGHQKANKLVHVIGIHDLLPTHGTVVIEFKYMWDDCKQLN